VKRLHSIQAGRGMAAIMVVFFHANVFIIPDQIYRVPGMTVWKGFEMGFAGVEFFFVLSGFIMMFVHGRDFGVPARFWPFVRNRILRIYPIYWIVLTGLLALYLLVMPGSGPETAREPMAIFTSYLLWPTVEAPVLHPAWTLRHEMLFYLVFGLVILNRRAGGTLFWLWTAVAALTVLLPELPHPWSFLISYYNVLFAFGLLAAMFYRALTPRQGTILFLLGTAAFFAIGLSDAYRAVAWAHDWRTICFGLAAAAIVTGLAAGSFHPGRLAVFLGDASYSIYLAHIPSMNAAAIVIRKLGLPDLLPVWAVFAVASVCGILGGCILHVVLERPLLRLFKARFSGTSALSRPKEARQIGA
jgi:peptidoglycan/LPS O-acetylase OafA/YrhL